MSSIESDLEGGEGGPTWEQLGHFMYNKKLKEFHTEIQKPDPMTAIDVAGEYWSKTISPGVGELIKSVQDWKRTNMIAYKRERAKETERMVKGNVEEEKRKKDMRELMLGMASR